MLEFQLKEFYNHKIFEEFLKFYKYFYLLFLYYIDSINQLIV